MKFHFELEQDEKQMCSEHYQKHFDMLFCSIQIQKSTGYITKKKSKYSYISLWGFVSKLLAVISNL